MHAHTGNMQRPLRMFVFLGDLETEPKTPQSQTKCLRPSPHAHLKKRRKKNKKKLKQQITPRRVIWTTPSLCEVVCEQGTKCI